MKLLMSACILLNALLATQVAIAADQYSQTEVQMVRSVLERQSTLMRLNALAVQHAASESVRDLARRDNEDQARLRAQLLAVAQAQGMNDIQGLQAPGYFQRAEARLQTLTGPAFEQQYLLLALQCHAFLERSLNGEIRSGSNVDLVTWGKQNIETFEQHSRLIDHALYELKDLK